MKPLPHPHNKKRTKTKTAQPPRRPYSPVGKARIYCPLRADADTYAALTLLAGIDGVSRVVLLNQLVGAELERRGIKQ